MGWRTSESGFNLCIRISQPFYTGNSENNFSYPEEPLHMKKKIKRPGKVAGREYNSITPKLL